MMKCNKLHLCGSESKAKHCAKQILRLPCCARNGKKNTELDIMHSAKETGFFTRTVRYNARIFAKNPVSDHRCVNAV